MFHYFEILIFQVFLKLRYVLAGVPKSWLVSFTASPIHTWKNTFCFDYSSNPAFHTSFKLVRHELVPVVL